MNNKFCKYINDCFLVKMQRCVSLEARNEEACWKYWEHQEAERLKELGGDVEKKE